MALFPTVVFRLNIISSVFPLFPWILGAVRPCCHEVPIKEVRNWKFGNSVASFLYKASAIGRTKDGITRELSDETVAGMTPVGTNVSITHLGKFLKPSKLTTASTKNGRSGRMWEMAVVEQNSMELMVETVMEIAENMVGECHLKVQNLEFQRVWYF